MYGRVGYSYFYRIQVNGTTGIANWGGNCTYTNIAIWRIIQYNIIQVHITAIAAHTMKNQVVGAAGITCRNSKGVLGTSCL